MSEYQASTFYNTKHYARTYKEVYSWLEKWLAETIFRGDSSRVFMASDNYVFRRRFELTDASRNFDSLPPSGLDFPFANYWPQNTGWRPDDRVAAKNAVMIYEGVYEGTTKVKAAPVILSIPVTFYFSREDEARFAYDTLYLLTYNEHYSKTTVQYGHETIQLPIGMTLKDLKFNPKFSESDWLTQNRMYIISANFDMRTYVLKTPKQSPWEGRSDLGDDDPGYEKYELTEKVTFNFDTSVYSGVQYEFKELQSNETYEDLNSEYTLIAYTIPEENPKKPIFYKGNQRVTEGSSRYNRILEIYENLKSEDDGFYSSFPERGEPGKVYVDVAPNQPVKYKWSHNQYVRIGDSPVTIDSFNVLPPASTEVPWTVQDIGTPEVGTSYFTLESSISRSNPDETSRTGKYTYKTGVQNAQLTVNGQEVPVTLVEDNDNNYSLEAFVGRNQAVANSVYFSETGDTYTWDSNGWRLLEDLPEFSTVKEDESGNLVPDTSSIENPQRDSIYKFHQEGDIYYYRYYDEEGKASDFDKELGDTVAESWYSNNPYVPEGTVILSFEEVWDTNDLPNSSNKDLGRSTLDAATACALYKVNYSIPDCYYKYDRGKRILDFTVSRTITSEEEPELQKDLLWVQTFPNSEEVRYWWCDEIDVDDTSKTLTWVELYEAPVASEAYTVDFTKLLEKDYSTLQPSSVYNYMLTVSFFKHKVETDKPDVILEDIPISDATKTFVGSVRTLGRGTSEHRKDDMYEDLTPAVHHKDQLLDDSRVKSNSRVQDPDGTQGWGRGGLPGIIGLEW